MLLLLVPALVMAIDGVWNLAAPMVTPRYSFGLAVMGTPPSIIYVVGGMNASDPNLSNKGQMKVPKFSSGYPVPLIPLTLHVGEPPWAAAPGAHPGCRRHPEGMFLLS